MLVSQSSQQVTNINLGNLSYLSDQVIAKKINQAFFNELSPDLIVTNFEFFATHRAL